MRSEKLKETLESIKEKTGNLTWDYKYFFSKQVNDRSCAINAQLQIIEETMGKNYDEQMFINYAKSNNFFREGDGTNPENIGKILDDLGFETHLEKHISLDQIKMVLRNGGDVIIGVDSKELWANTTAEITNGGLDHAVRIQDYNETPINSSS